MEPLIDVTVVIPLYNKAPFIRETLESVLRQDYPYFRIIVVDDCSSDTSVEVVSSMTDLRMKLYRNEKNLGTAGNANRCLELVETPYVIRQDADDIMPEGRIKRQVSFLKEYPDVAVVAGLNKIIGKSHAPKVILDEKEIKDELFFTNPVSQGTSGMNMQLIRASGVRYWEDGPKVGEDWLYFKMLAEKSRMVNLDEVFNLYRIHDANISDLGNERYQSDILRVMKTILEKVGLQPTPEDLQAHLLFRKTYKGTNHSESVKAFVRWCEKLKKHNQSQPFLKDAYLEKRIRDASRFLFFSIAYDRKAVRNYKQSFELDGVMKKYLLSLRLKNLFRIFGYRK